MVRFSGENSSMAKCAVEGGPQPKSNAQSKSLRFTVFHSNWLQLDARHLIWLASRYEENAGIQDPKVFETFWGRPEHCIAVLILGIVPGSQNRDMVQVPEYWAELFLPRMEFYLGKYLQGPSIMGSLDISERLVITSSSKLARPVYRDWEDYFGMDQMKKKWYVI